MLSDEYVLALGIKESLKNVAADPEEIDPELEANPAEINQELEVSNNVPVLDQSFANTGISNDTNAAGLNVLPDICDRFYA